MVVEEEVGEEVEEVGKREMGEREFVRDAFTVLSQHGFLPNQVTAPNPVFQGLRTGEGREKDERTEEGRTGGRKDGRTDERTGGRTEGGRAGRLGRKGVGDREEGEGSSSKLGRERGRWDGSFFVENKDKRGRTWNQR